MKLLSMTLQNFKGHKDITIAANGQNIIIFGENGAGKTTLFDAFLWLLFGKDSTGRTKFELKTLTSDGQVIEKIDHSVEAIFEHDGNEFTLKRVLSEKWSKPRGQADHVYGGDETTFSINDVPKKKGEYEAFVASLVTEEVFRMVTNPIHFNSQDWKKRREIMLQLVPGVDDDAVVATNSTLAPVLDLLKRATGADRESETLASLKATRKKLNDEIDAIPIRIDEINKGLEAPADTVSIDDLNAQKAALEEQKCAIAKAISEAVKKASEAKNLVFGQIGNITMQINKNLDLQREAERERQIIKDGLKRHETRIQQANEAIEDIERRAAGLSKELTEREEEKAALIKEWQDVKATVPPHVDTECPTCGQGLPEDQLQAKTVEIMERFEAQKTKDIKAIEDKGTKANDEIKRLKARIEELNRHQADQVAVIEKATQELEAEKVQAETPAADHTRNNAILEEQLAKLRAKADEPVEYVDTSAMDASLREAEEHLAYINRAIANQDVYAKAQERIKELRHTESRIGGMLVKVDGDIALVEQFIVAKVAMVEGKLNNLFKTVSFKLFDKQVNGGISETFVTLINGVPFPDANTAGQINSGLEIIEHLCQHYEFRAPVFIDHLESVTRLHQIGSQTIGLVVSKDHKNLTVEVI